MQIVILGARGQLGVDLFDVFGRDCAGFDLPELDVSDAAQTQAAIAGASPRVVVNCAAWTNVEEAEDHAADAFRVNAIGALNVARAAAAVGARVIYISTDYVFGAEGRAARPFVEDDRPGPLNIYGASKLAGEHATLAYCPGSTVLRTASLYGHAGARGKGGNFVETMLRLAAGGKPIRVVADQVMTPTSSLACARAVRELIEHPLAGVVHRASADSCSWFQFAQAIFEHEGLRVDLTPIPAAEYPTKARRAPDSSLGTTRPGPAPAPTWRAMLSEYLVIRDKRRAGLPGAAGGSA